MRLCKFDVKKNRYHPQVYFKATSDTEKTTVRGINAIINVNGNVFRVSSSSCAMPPRRIRELGYGIFDT